jgi:cellulose biosynthesis protein BcsQ
VSKPYILTVASHKGGTGRTTAALALAWAFGKAGRKVLLVDADEQRSATLVALDARGQVTWPNVEFRGGFDALNAPVNADLVVVDPPALTAPSVHPILDRANGIVLTCLADPLSIRTVPAAATVIENAKARNPQLELLGIVINIYNAQDLVQSAMLARLQQAHRELLLEPAIPFQPEMRMWPLKPGSPPPTGGATMAYAALARSLEPLVRVREPAVADNGRSA